MIKNSIIKFKHPATLLEVLIAMVLTTFVITTLTFFYSEVSLVGYEIDQVKKEHFYLRFVENRLADIIPKILPESDSEFTFFSIDSDPLTAQGSQSLIFAFKNGFGCDKPFSNRVIARMFVTKEGDLKIAYWPSRKQWPKSDPPMKKELLLQDVESLKFAFFIAPDKKEELNKNEPNQKVKTDTEISESKSPGKGGTWTDKAWLSEYKKLPVILEIKIKLKNKEQVLKFKYPLSKASAHIIYE